MIDEFEHAKDAFRWNERIFSYLGVWPLRSTYVWFTICCIYFVAHIIMEAIDLYSVLGDFELMVTNLSESTMQIMTFVKLLRLRFTDKLPILLERVMDRIDAKGFDSSDERDIYLNYNRMAKTFVKLWIWMGCAAGIGYWLKPMQQHLTAQEEDSTSYLLAYRVHFYFEVNDSTTFYLAWIYQAPVAYFGIWHTATIGLLFSLVLHASGLLAVLSLRIRSLNVYDRQNDETFRTFFQDILKKHREVLECVINYTLGLKLDIRKAMIFVICSMYRITNDINDIFGIVLLEELLLSTFLIGLTCYAALRSVDADDLAQFISYITYGSTLMLLLYGYCLAGEHLITESTNLYTAYYHCIWYDMPDSCKKQLIICMIGASKPVQLTAGGIYIFRLFNFMGIMKSSAGYISMLRSMM